MPFFPLFLARACVAFPLSQGEKGTRTFKTKYSKDAVVEKGEHRHTEREEGGGRKPHSLSLAHSLTHSPTRSFIHLPLPSPVQNDGAVVPLCPARAQTQPQTQTGVGWYIDEKDEHHGKSVHFDSFMFAQVDYQSFHDKCIKSDDPLWTMPRLYKFWSFFLRENFIR